LLVGKANIRAIYKNKPVDIPPQFDADNERLPDDFKLTEGSTINLAVELNAYKMASGSGLNLRIRGVQVIDYLPYTSPSPFGMEEGYTQGDTVEEVEESADNIFAEEEEVAVAEPVKRPKKKAATPPPDDDLSDVIDEWGSED
jgi:hypothetical protein